MNNNYQNRPAGPPNTKAGAGCIFAFVAVFLGILIVSAAVDGSDGAVLIIPFAMVAIVVFFVVMVARAAKTQQPPGASSGPFGGRPPYSAPPPRPGSPMYPTFQPAPPPYASRPGNQATVYDSHLCQEADHLAETPTQQRTSLNQLQSGYGTQSARLSGRHVSRREAGQMNYDESLKALVDAGIMTPEEYADQMRR